MGLVYRYRMLVTYYDAKTLLSKENSTFESVLPHTYICPAFFVFQVSQMPLQPLIIMEEENPKHSSPFKPEKNSSSNSTTNSLPRTGSR